MCIHHFPPMETYLAFILESPKQSNLINLANQAISDSFVLSVKSQYSEFKTKPCAAKGLLTGGGGKM